MHTSTRPPASPRLREAPLTTTLLPATRASAAPGAEPDRTGETAEAVAAGQWEPGLARNRKAEAAVVPPKQLAREWELVPISQSSNHAKMAHGGDGTAWHRRAHVTRVPRPHQLGAMSPRPRTNSPPLSRKHGCAASAAAAQPAHQLPPAAARTEAAGLEAGRALQNPSVRPRLLSHGG